MMRTWRPNTESGSDIESSASAKLEDERLRIHPLLGPQRGAVKSRVDMIQVNDRSRALPSCMHHVEHLEVNHSRFDRR